MSLRESPTRGPRLSLRGPGQERGTRMSLRGGGWETVLHNAPVTVTLGVGKRV